MERGVEIEEMEVDSMAIDGIEIGVPMGRDYQDFEPTALPAAAGGIGQRFYSKYWLKKIQTRAPF